MLASTFVLVNNEQSDNTFMDKYSLADGSARYFYGLNLYDQLSKKDNPTNIKQLRLSVPGKMVFIDLYWICYVIFVLFFFLFFFFVVVLRFMLCLGTLLCFASLCCKKKKTKKMTEIIN